MKNKYKKRNRQRQQNHQSLSSDRAQRSYQQKPPQQWPFPVAPEADEGYERLRNALHMVSEMRDHWAGIPMPLEGQRLIIEPKFPGGEELSNIGWKPEKELPEFEGVKVRNRFWSWSRRSEIFIFEYADGRVDWGLSRGVHHFDYDLNTLACADAWGLKQEAEAQKTLSSLVNPRQMKHYLMTGMFLESSRRSGTFYMFRRLKPTVAMKEDNGRMRVRACLCLHPIAYYAGSWAGAMCPTDDIIAHLMLMRGDEHAFWKQSNQHAAYRPEAGL